MQQEKLLDITLERHKDQFNAIGLPETLHRLTCEKILKQIFDAGEYFQFQEADDQDDENDETDTEQCIYDEIEGEKIKNISKYLLTAIDEIPANGNVFLIDHMWTTTFPQSRGQLACNSALLNRLGSMLSVESEDVASAVDGNQINNEIVRAVWNRMWPLLNCYCAGNSDAYTTWYLVDELGQAIQHCRYPNFKLCPLLVNLTGLLASADDAVFGISIMWPVQDIEAGDFITRDFFPPAFSTLQLDSESPIQNLSDELVGYTSSSLLSEDEKQVQCHLRLLRYLKLTGYMVPCHYENVAAYAHRLEYIANEALRCWKLCGMVDTLGIHADEHSPLTMSPSVAVDWNGINTVLLNAKSTSQALRIYCDRDDYLSSDKLNDCTRFQFVSSPEEADILYLIDHMVEDGETVSNHSNTSSSIRVAEVEAQKNGKILTQFWWEGMLVSKDHFARTMRAAHTKSRLEFESPTEIADHCVSPCTRHFDRCWPWIAATYDLGKPFEFALFILHFAEELQLTTRDESGIEASDKNTWILKKYRGRQGIDYPITDNLSCAVRHTDMHSRLACKYINQPCLYHGCKFDLRYYVMVLSLLPLRIYRHQIFVPRLANIPYSNDDLESYQKHFTVMGLMDEESQWQQIRGKASRNDPLMTDFIVGFDEENRSASSGCGGEGLTWAENVQPAIDRVLRQLFESVVSVVADEPLHPNQQTLHPNAGWSLNQPNACPGRAMYGVDILLQAVPGAAPQPVVLEVQYAPDCHRTHITHPRFWDITLSALFLENFRDCVQL